ncbi:MAG: PilZ domain-containing protein [Desulfuromonadaceae bacterium]|nr:PilZ domain-containing protein [Desulfuromonadaceae bacterium]
MKEKRHYKRVSFLEEVEITHANRIYPGVVIDISMKGILIKLEEMPVGDTTEQNWRIRLPLSDDVHIIVNVRPSHCDLKSRALGFEFTKIDADSMAHLRRLLELNTGDAEAIERELGQMVADMKLQYLG